MHTPCIERYAPLVAKKRVTVTVDETLLEVAAQAVQHGDAESVSAWISDAMHDRYAKERRLAALSELVADYEDAHGVITDAEMREQEQADRDAAAFHRVPPAPSPR